MVNALAGLHLKPSDYEAPSAERWMMMNLRQTISHVNRYWLGRLTQEKHAGIVTQQDLISEASELLWKAAQDFPDWARSQQLDPYSGAIFWAFARKAIDWGLANYLRGPAQKTVPSLEQLSGEDSEDDYPSEDLVRTQMSRFRPPSMLHSDIADRVIVMRRDWRILIALRYFEELPYKQVARLAGMDTQDVVIARINDVCDHLRQQALALVVEHPYRVQPPRKLNIADTMPELDTYIWTKYGTDVTTWLGWIAQCYRQDVSYITDLLQHGHIIRAFGKTVARNRGLTDAQVREIRARREAGASVPTIADDYHVHKSTIEKIIGNQTYMDVR